VGYVATAAVLNYSETCAAIKLLHWRGRACESTPFKIAVDYCTVQAQSPSVVPDNVDAIVFHCMTNTSIIQYDEPL